MPLLLHPQQIAPVDGVQQALTQRHLAGRLDALMDYFLALRAQTDAAFAPHLPPAAGKDYPYGRCEEITRELHGRLQERLRAPVDAMDHALRQFAQEGGVVRSIWGVLREQYFQNAIQLGGLYVDVSNDTVFVAKPKVEILPVGQCGLVPVRDLAHFRRIAASYWQAEIYANHVAPTLAPLLPMISHSPGRLDPALQSACDYMISLMRHGHFHDAEAWLRDGPPPSAAVREALYAAVPQDLHPWTGDAREEAVAACRRARAAGSHASEHWRNARVMDFLRVGAG